MYSFKLAAILFLLSYSLVSTLQFIEELGLKARSIPSPTPCQTFNFTIPVQESNDSGVVLPAALYDISATHCLPLVRIPSRETTVQLLLHGATANKFYWSALGSVGAGFEEYRYSWVDVARRNGYHTVAIDRLGVGNSSHPNPNFVRLPVEADITAQIIQQLRSSPLPAPWPQRTIPFGKIILVSHSVASLLVNYMIVDQPSIADAVILTGFVHNFTLAPAGTADQQFLAAASIFPARFSGLDPGYLTIASASNERDSFFGPNGSFDPRMPTLNWEREDVQAIGEQKSLQLLLTSSFPTQIAAGFTRPTAIIVGQQDLPLCDGNCGIGPDNLAEKSRTFFPNSRAFQAFVVENTGHFLNLHYSATRTFELAHRWLSDIGF